MRITFVSCVTLAIYGLCNAQHDVVHKPRTIQWTIQKDGSFVTPSFVRYSSLRRRDKTVLQKIDNKAFLFYAKVSLGTPPQSFHLHVDTGSSDTWVQSPKSKICTSKKPSPCDLIGSYDNTTSSTYKYLKSNFAIKYMDGGIATGDYCTDHFSIGGATIKNLQFGYGLQSDVREGVMGLGFRMNEAQVRVSREEPYDNLPYAMAKQGFINSVAYSIWLNDLSSSTGEILFGGIDTEKYHGKLSTLPIDRRRGEKEASQFVITMTGMVFVDRRKRRTVIQGNRDPFMGVLLDTGASFTYLPDHIADRLASLAGAKMNDKVDGPTLPCAWRFKYPESYLNFFFSGIDIKVPMDELIVDCYYENGTVCADRKGEPLCYFGILRAGSTIPSLGDTFLRSVYVVYDLENEKISMAPTFYNSTKSNIIEIGEGENPVPFASVISTAATVEPTATEAVGGIVGGPTVVDIGTDPSTTSTSTSQSSVDLSIGTRTFSTPSSVLWIAIAIIPCLHSLA